MQRTVKNVTRKLVIRAIKINLISKIMKVTRAKARCKENGIE
jgi:hypothetical protein